MTKSKIFIQKNRKWDFTVDGLFSRNRIKGKDKEFLKKQRRLFEKEDENKIISDELVNS